MAISVSMAKKQKPMGFRESRQKRYRAARRPRGKVKAPVRAAPSAGAGLARTDVVRVTLGPGGRFVIPKKLRKAMNVEVGDEMNAEVVNGELGVLGRDAAGRQVAATVA